MSKSKTILQKLSGAFLVLLLLWLTVNAPFVNTGRLCKASSEKKMTSSSPLAGTEEEKSPGSSLNTMTEYLHEGQEIQHPFCLIHSFHIAVKDDTYTAFHGELVSPPPEV